MATLQKIRSKGPLLVIVIGVALFAFIAGDAWKVLQPHQTQDVGEIDGDVLTAQEYQALVEEYTDIIKFTSGMASLNDQQNDQIKDEVWRAYVNNKLIEKEAKAIGLTVSKAEIQAIINEGTHPLLQQTPFRNPQTGAFDKDMLNMFLVEYSKMKSANMPSQAAEYYQTMYQYWSFLEKNLIQGRLAEKYQALIANSLLSNTVEAQASFDARVNQSDMLLVGIPYSAIADSLVKITKSDIEKIYADKKGAYKQDVETRDIKYIDVQVTASAEDRAALDAEMLEYTDLLEKATDDYASLVRSTSSMQSYSDLFLNKTAFPRDVVSRFDSVKVGGVFGPYYNLADNTLNTFKMVDSAMAPDSIEYRQIQVMAQDPAAVKTLADSIYTALKNGANFEDLAKRYGQTGDKNWLVASAYENQQLDGDNLKYVSTLNKLKKNALEKLTLGQATLVLQVTDRKAMQEKYKVAVVKREVEFSKETYNKAYNNFSEFIAANTTIDEMVKNAEEAGYRVLDRADLYSAEHMIGGVTGTKEALRWVFAAKKGDVSGLFECGESDHMMMVAVEGINPEGYRPLEKMQAELRAQAIKDKKAEIIKVDMKNAKTLVDYQALANVVSDSVKHVTFSANAYIPSLRSSEPLVSSFASVSKANQLSAPIVGNQGVFVLQTYAQDKMTETFDATVEKNNISSMNARMASRFVGDLYQKAEVVDNRYLYF